jgi:hypothetical protein
MSGAPDHDLIGLVTDNDQNGPIGPFTFVIILPTLER